MLPALIIDDADVEAALARLDAVLGAPAPSGGERLAA
jgi:hypothetical protein